MKRSLVTRVAKLESAQQGDAQNALLAFSEGGGPPPRGGKSWRHSDPDRLRSA
jgi:hypothetical protein